MVNTVKVSGVKVGGAKLTPQTFTYPKNQVESSSPDMVKAQLSSDWTGLQEVTFYYNEVPTGAPGNRTVFWFDSFKYIVH